MGAREEESENTRTQKGVGELTGRRCVDVASFSRRVSHKFAKSIEAGRHCSPMSMYIKAFSLFQKPLHVVVEARQ